MRKSVVNSGINDQPQLVSWISSIHRMSMIWRAQSPILYISYPKLSSLRGLASHMFKSAKILNPAKVNSENQRPSNPWYFKTKKDHLPITPSFSSSCCYFQRAFLSTDPVAAPLISEPSFIFCEKSSPDMFSVFPKPRALRKRICSSLLCKVSRWEKLFVVHQILGTVHGSLFVQIYIYIHI